MLNPTSLSEGFVENESKKPSVTLLSQGKETPSAGESKTGSSESALPNPTEISVGNQLKNPSIPTISQGKGNDPKSPEASKKKKTLGPWNPKEVKEKEKAERKEKWKKSLKSNPSSFIPQNFDVAGEAQKTSQLDNFGVSTIPAEVQQPSQLDTALKAKKKLQLKSASFGVSTIPAEAQQLLPNLGSSPDEEALQYGTLVKGSDKGLNTVSSEKTDPDAPQNESLPNNSEKESEPLVNERKPDMTRSLGNHETVKVELPLPITSPKDISEETTDLSKDSAFPPSQETEENPQQNLLSLKVPETQKLDQEPVSQSKDREGNFSDSSQKVQFSYKSPMPKNKVNFLDDLDESIIENNENSLDEPSLLNDTFISEISKPSAGIGNTSMLDESNFLEGLLEAAKKEKNILQQEVSASRVDTFIAREKKRALDGAENKLAAMERETHLADRLVESFLTIDNLIKGFIGSSFSHSTREILPEPLLKKLSSEDLKNVKSQLREKAGQIKQLSDSHDYFLGYTLSDTVDRLKKMLDLIEKYKDLHFGDIINFLWESLHSSKDEKFFVKDMLDLRIAMTNLAIVIVYNNYIINKLEPEINKYLLKLSEKKS